MNKDILKGNWKEIQGKLKVQWGKLTDDEISKIDGNWDMLEGLLQKKYGFKKEEAERDIKAFLEEHNWDTVE